MKPLVYLCKNEENNAHCNNGSPLYNTKTKTRNYPKSNTTTVRVLYFNGKTLLDDNNLQYQRGFVK